LFEHCYPCGGFGFVLQNLANGLNEPLNELFATIAEGMSFLMTEGIEDRVTPFAERGGDDRGEEEVIIGAAAKKIDKGRGMWLFLSY
jgi:hypothetical protein